LKKERVDKLLVSQGLAESRTQAQAFVMAGWVCFGDHLVLKPSEIFPENTVFRLKDGVAPKYVSRGGDKMEGALRALNLNVNGWTVLDVGISTGGFTDCLLQAGAKKITGLDVGHNQLHWKLKNDKRLTHYEGVNARDIPTSLTIEMADLIVIDVSFISLTLVISGVKPFLKPGGKLLALIKPQFEVNKGEVGKGGIVKDPLLHAKVQAKIENYLATEGFKVERIFPSSIKGTDGNTEFFIFAHASGGSRSL
jgi:23S rRNA (cytidine1920-2'-O)/16S rRNA (cytidine1409-2'-O)-methyltransferase